jgi:hypothetical protein
MANRGLARIESDAASRRMQGLVPVACLGLQEDGYRIEAAARSAKADFVPFQRRVSNPTVPPGRVPDGEQPAR